MGGRQHRRGAVTSATEILWWSQAGPGAHDDYVHRRTHGGDPPAAPRTVPTTWARRRGAVSPPSSHSPPPRSCSSVGRGRTAVHSYRVAHDRARRPAAPSSTSSPSWTASARPAAARGTRSRPTPACCGTWWRRATRSSTRSRTATRAELRDELGDLLLQVVFHARVAQEDPEEPFEIDDVAAAIVAKLERRHPHVFAGEAVARGPAGRVGRDQGDGEGARERAGRDPAAAARPGPRREGAGAVAAQRSRRGAARRRTSTRSRSGRSCWTWSAAPTPPASTPRRRCGSTTRRLETTAREAERTRAAG